jgi:iron complex outermembrane recepter protein
MTRDKSATRSLHLISTVAAAALTGMLPCAVAYAQDTGAGEIIVTAQKREQKLKDVPIVVTTLSAKVLQNAGVHDIKDMQVLTPGLTVTSTQNEALTTARIRGVGTVGDNPGMESSVGVVIDGVYRPRNGVGFGDLGEMERIEVLKGPQGTLFGKNTSAGVINVITKAPSFKFGADGEVTFGNYGQKGVAASVTGPLVEDKLAGRLYVAHRERDGYYDVIVPAGSQRTDTDDANQDFTTIRAQLLSTASDTTSMRFIADYTKREERCCVAVQIRTGPTGALINALTPGGLGIDLTPDPKERTAYANRDTAQDIEDRGLSLEINHDLSFAKLTSVSAFRQWDAQNGQDIDYTGANILHRENNGDFYTRFKTISQELRLAGSTDKLNWLIGGFYTKEDMDRGDSYVYGTAYEPFIGLLLSSGTNPNQVTALTGKAPGTNYVAGSGARDVYTQKATSLALFTNNSYKLTDALELTLGLRYTSDEKKMTGVYSNTGTNGVACGTALAAQALYPAIQRGAIIGALCPFWANPAFNGRQVANSKKNTNLSGTFKAAYHFNEDVMAYASYAKGFKDGGYNLDRAQTTGLSGTSIVVTPDSNLYFPAETVDSFELGLKTSLMSNRLMLNITAFDQTFNDFQLNTFLGTAFVVESIPELTSKGIDADIYWTTPIKGLGLQGGLTYAETEYGNFTAADLINPSHFAGLSLLPGAQMSFAPKVSASLAATWSGDVGGLRGSWNIAAKYTDDYNTGSDLIPYKSQEAFTLVNARIGIGAKSQKWLVELWGQNLTDVAYKQVVLNAPLQGTGFQSAVQATGSNPGTYYNKALDTNTYDAFMGQPRTYGVTLRVKY